MFNPLLSGPRKARLRSAVLYLPSFWNGEESVFYPALWECTEARSAFLFAISGFVALLRGCEASISATEVTEVLETTKGEAKSMETTDGQGPTRIKEKH